MPTMPRLIVHGRFVLFSRAVIHVVVILLHIEHAHARVRGSRQHPSEEDSTSQTHIRVVVVRVVAV